MHIASIFSAAQHRPGRQLAWCGLALTLACSAGAQTVVPVAPGIFGGLAGVAASAGAAATPVTFGGVNVGSGAGASAVTPAVAASTDAAPTWANLMTQSKVEVRAAPEAPKGDAAANAKDAAPKSQAPSPQDPPAVEVVKNPKADETEFQRFVLSATGQTLPLYGFELFAKSSTFEPAQATPMPAGYRLGPGDEIVVQITGLFEMGQTFVIDREGRILLPKVGPISLAGVAFSDAEKVLTGHVGKVFRNFTVSVSMGRLRSIEVFVVGQARQPGKHVVSSMSGLVNALLETGGPSSNGSMRAIELRRAGKTVATMDLYAFLSQGDNSADVPLLAGDIVYIPPVGDRAAVLGTINAPAIYELKPGETLAQVLALSGGLPTLASPQKAQLERVDAKRDIARYVEDFVLDAEGQKLRLKGGDILTVFQISPQIANVVTLEGNVAAPLRYAFRPGMRVSDLLSDKRLLIPGLYWTGVNRGAQVGNYSRAEVNLDYATIQRLDPVALRTKIIGFNLGKAVAQDPAEDLALASGDIVTVYGPNDAGVESEGSVTITGEIVGGFRRFVWRDGFTIKDIIPSTQWLVDYYNYWQRASARSLNNDINWDYAQVIRRSPANLQTKAITFNLGRAVLDGKPQDNIRLEAGDQIALFTTAQVPVPAEKRAQVVTLTGEVMVPGSYQLEPGETLPALIQRAGGLAKNAFAYGTVFIRESNRQQQQENLNKAKQRIQAQLDSQGSTAVQNASDSTKAAALQAQIDGQKQLIKRMEELKATGRVALDLDPESPVMPLLVMENGDTVHVPTRSSFVGVYGEVYSESALIHRPNLTVGDYLDKAGLTRDADADNLIVVRADGTVEGSTNRLAIWSTGLKGKKLSPGDSVFVPSLVDRRTAYSLFIEGAKDWTSLLYQFALGAAAFKTLRN